jgi:hypothetical protein
VACTGVLSLLALQVDLVPVQATSVFKGGVVIVSLRSQRLQDGHLQQQAASVFVLL